MLVSVDSHTAAPDDTSLVYSSDFPKEIKIFSNNENAAATVASYAISTHNYEDLVTETMN